MSEGAFDDFDALAHVETARESLYNARYERPAIRALAGDVRGLDVLDAGCAGGDQALWLHEQGARVFAIDASESLVQTARRRLPPEVQVRVHDLREPLPIPKESVDLVISSLTLHYVRDWDPPMREFRRVTRPGGALVFSTHHPCLGLHDTLGIDYFSTGLVEDSWEGFGGDPVTVRYWRRPLQAIVGPVLNAGWRIEKIVEPRLDDAIDPWFILVRATR